MGGRCRRACVYFAHAGAACGGVQGTRSGTPLFFSSGLQSSCWCVGGGGVPGALGPSRGAGEPYTMGECVGQVTCGFLQPTTEPQGGARGVWSEVLLDRPRGSRVALHRVPERVLWWFHRVCAVVQAYSHVWPWNPHTLMHNMCREYAFGPWNVLERSFLERKNWSGVASTEGAFPPKRKKTVYSCTQSDKRRLHACAR